MPKCYIWRMGRFQLSYSLIDGDFAVCHLPSDSSVPAWAMRGDFWNVIQTKDELSVICLQDQVPKEVLVQKGWACFRWYGGCDLGNTGLMAALSLLFAEGGVHLISVASFGSEFFLIRGPEREKAVNVLNRSGEAHQRGAESGARFIRK